MAPRPCCACYADGGRRSVHRDDCQCIICKQSRRNGTVWAGMQHAVSLKAEEAEEAAGDGIVAAAIGAIEPATGPAGAAAAAAASVDSGSAAMQAGIVKTEQQQQQQEQQQQEQQEQQEQGPAAAEWDEGQQAPPSGAPRFRDGKRAYLRALPQLATAGATPSQVRVPSMHAFTHECSVVVTALAMFQVSLSCSLKPFPPPLYICTAAPPGAAVPLLDPRGLGGAPPAPGGACRSGCGGRAGAGHTCLRPAAGDCWQQECLRRQPGAQGAPAGTPSVSCTMLCLLCFIAAA